MRIADLSEMGLSRSVNRMVIDQTGLAGGFEWTLEWTSDSSSSAQTGAANLAGVSIFTALQEQLGLKLEAARGRVPVLVVDHVERLTQD